MLPMAVLVVVSFFDYDSVQIIPGFVLTNYRDCCSAVTWRTYLNTLRFTAIVWAVTLVVGFTVAYLSRLPGAQPRRADGAVPGLHHPVPGPRTSSA